MKKKNRQEWESNRNMQQRPKKSGKNNWCICDKCIVEHNKKCPECGKKESSKSFKK